MSSQTLKGLAVLVLGVLLACFTEAGLAAYCILGWGGFLFLRGLSESGAE